MPTGHRCLEVFARCIAATQGHKLIRRESRQDKEFHFQRKMTNQLQSGACSQGRRLIESDKFPIEIVSQLAELESWRKEVHRPIYHIHKWWVKRLGSVFRAMLLGSAL